MRRKTAARCRSARTQRLEPPPWKLLLWTALAGLDLRPDRLWRDRRGLASHRPQQPSLAQGQRRHRPRQDRRHSRSGDVGSWPWPRRYHGATDRRAYARPVPSGSSSTSTSIDPNDTCRRRAASPTALQRSGRVVLLALTRFGPGRWPCGSSDLRSPTFANAREARDRQRPVQLSERRVATCLTR